MPTAISTTFPRIANSLNSFKMPIFPPLRWGAKISVWKE
jgi:hypothetical protein